MSNLSSKRNWLFFLLFVASSILTYAQPGGGPGGRPMGPPPGGPGGVRPSMSDRERMRRQAENERAAQKAQEVRQKRNVKAGDTFKVVGTLRDSTNNEPVAYVNLVILTREDSTMVKGGITDLNGSFELSGIPQGDFFLKVSAIGYRNFMIPFTVSNNTALGVLKLVPGATTLNEVKVTAQRPLYAMDGEKLVYNVAEDPTVQTGTTSDALQNAPGVEVDIEGNITLRGVSSVEIWVNDKPSKLTAENLKTYLETLPANALDRIETITNPSAKYATSAEAVINIVTSAYVKSNHFISFGANGSIPLTYVSPWVSYTWANERLSINIFGSGRYSNSKNSGWSKTTYRKDHDTEANGLYDTTLVESYDNESHADRYGGHLFANISYEIDSMTDISFFGMGNFNSNKSLSTLSRGREDRVGNNNFNYVDTNDNKGLSGFGMAGLDFTHKFDKNGHNIRASLHHNFNRGNSQNDFIRLFDPIVTTGAYTNYDKAYLDDNTRNTLSFTVRYNRPYSENGELSYGLGVQREDTWRNYHVYDDYSTARNTDYLRSYSFNDKEHEIWGDVEWTRRWGGFTMELGLGVYYDNINFVYKGSELYPFTNDDSICGFFRFRPSVHLSYRTDDMHNYKLNYTLSMSRPGEENLTTYKRYTLDSYSIGNRNLGFSYTHSVEAGWSKYFMEFGNVGLEGYARYSANEIDNLTTSTPEDDPILNRIVQFTQPYNMGSSYRVGASANVMFRPSGFINVRLYANVYDYGYHMDRPGKPALDNHKWSYSVRLNAWAKLWDNYQVFTSLNYTSSTISLAMERKPHYYFNLGVRADFFKRKMSVYVNVQDLFNWGKTIGTGSTSTDPYLLSESNTYTLNSRYISAGITFRFGKMELENRNKSGEETSDTSSL